MLKTEADRAILIAALSAYVTEMGKSEPFNDDSAWAATVNSIWVGIACIEGKTCNVYHAGSWIDTDKTYWAETDDRE